MHVIYFQRYEATMLIEVAAYIDAIAAAMMPPLHATIRQLSRCHFFFIDFADAAMLSPLR